MPSPKLAIGFVTVTSVKTPTSPTEPDATDTPLKLVAGEATPLYGPGSQYVSSLHSSENAPFAIRSTATCEFAELAAAAGSTRESSETTRAKSRRRRIAPPRECAAILHPIARRPTIFRRCSWRLRHGSVATARELPRG